MNFMDYLKRNGSTSFETSSFDIYNPRNESQEVEKNTQKPSSKEELLDDLFDLELIDDF